MTQYRTQLAPLATLEGILPFLLRHLSLGRAQIAIDHLRGAIDTKTSDRIVLLTLCDANDVNTPLAAVIAIQQSDPASQSGDIASIIHAGMIDDAINLSPAKRKDGASELKTAQTPVAETTAIQSQAMLRQLSLALEHELETRGVGFVQWATDLYQSLDDSTLTACAAFGFHTIGSLDYLSGSIPGSVDAPFQIKRESQLQFRNVNWSRSEFQQFEELVQTTYTQTLDCPQMSRYRTASQTLRGYQASFAFDSNLWFTAHDEHGMPIGCVILARHEPAASADNDSKAIIEIVYMGLVPEARGTGRGKSLVQHAFTSARSAGAARIILAVDQNNYPARTIYDLAGLQPMLSETVWVKLIGSATQ